MRRRGMTLTELMVAIAVTAILLALLLPAVQAARETARRAQCHSNLRQIGLALHNYESLYGMWPAASFSYSTSWQVAILPYLDQAALYQQVDFALPGPFSGVRPTDPIAGVVLPGLLCPSDAAPRYDGAMKKAATSYLGNSGSGLQVNGYDGMFCHMAGWNPNCPEGQVRTGDVTDGLSTTAAVSEVLHTLNLSTERLRMVWNTPVSQTDVELFRRECSQIPEDPVSVGWRQGSFLAHGFQWVFGEIGYSTYNHMLPPMQTSCFNGFSVQDGIYSAGSGHRDVVNVLFADGHVARASRMIDSKVWAGLGSRNGSESIQP